MGNRIIKESICLSDTIDQLSWFEEVVFYRLIVNCDDYGRFDGRIPAVKNLLFPLKTNITEKTVADAINKLSTVGLVMPYFWDGKPILQLATWDKHQTVRNKRSKYPAADGSMETSASKNIQLISIDFNCMQMNTDECNCSSNPIQSESNPNTNPTICAEQAPAPAVITLTLNDKSEYPVTQEYADEMAALYPAVDVMQQLRGMRAWCTNNPTKRKTKAGIRRFINSWLSREQDKGRASPPDGATSQFRGVTEVI